MKNFFSIVKVVMLVSSLAIVIFISTAATFKVDFSGEWTLDQSKSELGEFGARMAATKLSVKQEGEIITVVRTASTPMGESVTTDKITLDGKESPSTGGMEGSTRKTTSKLSADQNTLTVSSATSLSFNGNSFDIAATETWTLSADGKILTIDAETTTQMGSNKTKMVYTKP